MRRTSRLFAAVKSARYLEAGAPTGLTGLLTHVAPRSTLIYIYSSTLEKLKQLPESSVYRQSTEALAKHRLKIVTSVVPVGFEEWLEKAKKTIADHPEVFNTPEGGADYGKGGLLKQTLYGQTFVTTKLDREIDEINDEWDGEEDNWPELEGTRTTEGRKGQSVIGMEMSSEDEKKMEWDPEPPLNAEQISNIENQIGAGLIEEVIQVAEGELKLLEVMTEAKVWEDLEEKPAEGQWTYFMRETDTGKTQTPPQTN